MSTLWVFGDSYGTHVAQDPKQIHEWFWTYDLGKKLNCNNYGNYSQLGVSNNFIQLTLTEHQENIKPEDYVIVITTSISRQWFFKDKPWLSNLFQTNNLDDILDRNSINALQYYARYLYNPANDALQFHQYLGWLHYMTNKNNWNLIVVPGFEENGYPVSNLYQVTGSLFDICFNEFLDKGSEVWFYGDYSKGRDRRAGHLLKCNHAVLSEKLYNTFTKKEPLDLTSGFHQKLISKNTISKYEDQLSTIVIKDFNLKGFVPNY